MGNRIKLTRKKITEIFKETEGERVSINPIALERARRGAALLDVKRPNWYNEINTVILDLTTTTKCILGQLYDDYTKGLNIVAEGSVGLRWSAAHGYSREIDDSEVMWKELNRAWLKLIEERKVATVQEENFTRWYVVLDGPFSVALMTTSDIEAASFASGLTYAGVENTLVEKKVYNA